MSNITYADKSDGDFFTSSDANQIKTAVNSKEDSLVTESFNATITFDVNGRVVHTLAANTALGLASSGNETGVKKQLVITGNNFTLTFPSDWRLKSGTFTITAVNVIDLEYVEGIVLYEIN